MSNTDDVTIDFDELKHETDSAVLVEIDGEDIWIPKSQITTMSDFDLDIPEWLAIEKGLI